MPDLSDPNSPQGAQAFKGQALKGEPRRKAEARLPPVREDASVESPSSHPSSAARKGGRDATRTASRVAAPERRREVRDIGDIDPGKLTQLLEAEIIPRLLVAHMTAPPPTPLKRPATPGRFDARAVDEFAQLILTQDMPIVFDHVETLLDRGVPVEEVFLALLAPTARRLGEYWTSDYCSFFDVTVGLGRLQQVLLALRLDGSVNESRPEPAKTALFATLEGEGHGFGLLMVDELFRRAGWRTVTRIGASAGEIAAIAKSSVFEVVGFGASCDVGLAQLGIVIKRVRESSLNRGVRVMVGGQIFLERPELGVVVGADLVATCAQDALSKAEKTISHQGGRV